MNHGRLEHLAQNEADFRGYNETLDAGPEQRRSRAQPMMFLCECSDPFCGQNVLVAADDYEAVRGNSRRFLVITGHELLEAEYVVERKGNVTVVEKRDNVAHVVERSDPRRGDG